MYFPTVAVHKKMRPRPSRAPVKGLTALLSLACVFALSPPRPASASGSIDLVPSEAVLAAFLNIKEDDPGQKWLFGELTHYLISEAGKEEEVPEIKDVDLFHFSDFCYCLLPPDREGKEQMLMAAELISGKGTFGLTYGKSRIQLNVRDEKAATTTQTQLLTLLLGIACRIPPGAAPEDGIYSTPAGLTRRSFNSYSVTDERAIVASRKEIIKAAREGKTRITSTAAYTEIMSLLPRGWDLYGYAQNDNGSLDNALGPKGKGWKNLVMALFTPARRAGLAVDVVDRDTSRVAAVFGVANAAEAHLLRMRFEPALGPLVTQYLDPQIVCALTYEELPKALRINAQLSNTNPFWRRVFRKAFHKHREKQRGEGKAGTKAVEIREGEHSGQDK